jgi:hypothetical protein
MAFQAKITRARWVLGSFTSEDMLAIANVVRDSIATRIGKGLNIEDEDAKPLKPGRNGHRGYPDYKAARGPNALPRLGLDRAHHALAQSKERQRKPRRYRLYRPNADHIAHVNNLREKQFGISPKDRQAMAAIIRYVLRQSRVISVRKAA